MFEKASGKLQDARTAVDAMGTAMDGQTYRAYFNAALSALRSVPEVLPAEGKRFYRAQGRNADTKAVSDWCKVEYDQIVADDLMRFVMESRNLDLHEGVHRLNFGSDVGPDLLDSFAPATSASGVVTVQPMTISLGDMPQPPVPGADLVISADGKYWLVDKGLPSERRIPFREGGSFVPTATTVTVLNPPANHKGCAINVADPLELCAAALAYLEDYVHRARATFTE